MPDRSQKALADFVSEAQESIDALGRDLMRLDGGGEEPDPDLLNAVFRAAHSLKGLSSMFGVERMARLAHALEDLLDDVRMGRRRLDRAAMDLLLEAPEVFSRIIAEEAEGQPPRTADAAARLVDRLRARDAPREPAAEDPLDSLALAPGVRAVLTEYEEHRLRSAVAKGRALWRVDVSFGLATFDRDLAALGARLKTVGELVSTLPSSDARDPQAIAFELLVASAETADEIRAAAGAGARVEPIAGTATPAGPLPAPAATPQPANLTPLPEAAAEDGP
ncbi:MAG TPA: Hpt domain-containing protein, partial [Anaeromyxobacter sp.]|nr:Hpt domain-containing protein [Anaeromyxobacter sp.]